MKKSSKELESLAKDIETFDKKIKEDQKVAAFIREFASALYELYWGKCWVEWKRKRGYWKIG